MQWYIFRWGVGVGKPKKFGSKSYFKKMKKLPRAMYVERGTIRELSYCRVRLYSLFFNLKLGSLPEVGIF